jgi:hypothetical protein
LDVEEKPEPAFVVEEMSETGSRLSGLQGKIHIGLNDGEMDLSFDPDLHLRSDSISSSSCTTSSTSSLPLRRRKLREVRFQEAEEVLGIRNIAPKFPPPPQSIGYSPPSSMKKQLPIGISDSERMNRIQPRHYAMAASASTPSLVLHPRSASTSPRRSNAQLKPESLGLVSRSRLSLPAQPIGGRYLSTSSSNGSTTTLTLDTTRTSTPRPRSPAARNTTKRPGTATSTTAPTDSDTEGIVAAHGGISFSDDVNVNLDDDIISPLPFGSLSLATLEEGVTGAVEYYDSDVEGNPSRGFAARRQGTGEKKMRGMSAAATKASLVETTTVAGVRMVIRGNLRKARSDSPFPLVR